MGWKAGAKLLQSDLLVGLRHWYASTSARDADITAPVAGTKAVIGSGAGMWEYVYDGSAWLVLTSPWVALAGVGGWTPSDGPACRMLGGLVTWRGTMSGTAGTGANNLGTVPAGFRPPDSSRVWRMLANSNSAAQPVFALIDTGGALTFYPSAGAGAVVIGLGGLSGYSVT